MARSTQNLLDMALDTVSPAIALINYLLPAHRATGSHTGTMSKAVTAADSA